MSEDLVLDYIALAERSAGLIAARGRTVTLVRETGGGFDPVAGTYTPPSEEAHQCTAVFTAFSPKEVDGSLVRSEDVMALIAANGVPIRPEVDQTLRDDGQTYAIVRVDEICPGDTALYYRLHLRR